MDYDGLLELVKNRRSIRRFKPDPIPDDYIDKIIEVARWAPSGFNMQPWEFVVIKKADLRKRIADLLHENRATNRKLETAREKWQGKPWKRTCLGLPMYIRHDPGMRKTIYLAGLANAFIYMHLAATTLGLATQWISAVQTSYVHCMIKDLLGIPMDLEVFDMIALGYPAITPREKLMRDPDEMVHYDDCGQEDFRNEEEIKDFIKRARNWNIGSHRRV